MESFNALITQLEGRTQKYPEIVPHVLVPTTTKCSDAHQGIEFLVNQLPDHSSFQAHMIDPTIYTQWEVRSVFSSSRSMCSDNAKSGRFLDQAREHILEHEAS